MSKGKLRRVSVIAIILCFALFSTVLAHGLSIKDIDKSSDYAKQAIINLANNSIIHGDQNGNFNPHNTITRAETVKMLVNALEISTDNTPNTATFKDVPTNHWAFEFVEAAYREGIIQGTSKDTFGVNQKSTREQMAVMFVRALGITDADSQNLSGLDKVEQLADKNQVSSWATYQVEIALQTGLMHGVGNKNFAPRGEAKREQAAVVIDRFITNRNNILDLIEEIKVGQPIQHPDLYEALRKAANQPYKGLIMTNLFLNFEGGEDDYFRIQLEDFKKANNQDVYSEGRVVLQIAGLENIEDNYITIIKDGELYMWDEDEDTYIKFEDDFFDPADHRVDSLDIAIELFNNYRKYQIENQGRVEIDGTEATKYSIAIDGKTATTLLGAEYGFLMEDALEEMDNNGFEFDLEIVINDKQEIVRIAFNFSGVIEEDEEAVTITMQLLIGFRNIGEEITIEAPTEYEIF